MRIRRTISMLIWNMILCTIMYSQTDTRLPQVIPPSPNAAAIQKYGELSVSAYTGAPNISIPLYTVTAGNLSMPVSISYNPSGIKVADEASRVGLGWILNAGGTISRTVVGKDDFDANSYSYHNQSIIEIPKAPRFDQGSNFNIKEGCDVTLSGYGINYTIPSTVFSDGGNYDLQPDTYAYNFNGHSGKFILRRNRDVVLNNIEKIDIKLIGTEANSWEIKTPDGVLYKFEQFETYVENGGTGQPHKSSWYITKIISPKGDSVSFNYTNLSAYIHTVGSFFESKPGVNLAANSSAQTAPSPLSYYSAPVPGKWYSNLCLSKISFNNGEVIFNYAADRLDVEGDLRLTNVQVYAKRLGEANQLMKTWNFKYGYFDGQNFIGGYNPNVSENNLSKRLKLSSIQETSGLSSLPPYEFFYNNEYDNSTSLPGKLSFARDHWGYYNGAIQISIVTRIIVLN